MKVDLVIVDSEVGRLVRFYRELTSHLGHTYNDTDLITVVDLEHESALRDDFERYRQLDRVLQFEFIRALKWSRYTGRILQDLPRQESQSGLF